MDKRETRIKDKLRNTSFTVEDNSGNPNQLSTLEVIRSLPSRIAIALKIHPVACLETSMGMCSLAFGAIHRLILKARALPFTGGEQIISEGSLPEVNVAHVRPHL